MKCLMYYPNQKFGLLKLGFLYYANQKFGLLKLLTKDPPLESFLQWKTNSLIQELYKVFTQTLSKKY